MFCEWEMSALFRVLEPVKEPGVGGKSHQLLRIWMYEVPRGLGYSHPVTGDMQCSVNQPSSADDGTARVGGCSFFWTLWPAIHFRKYTAHLTPPTVEALELYDLYQPTLSAQASARYDSVTVRIASNESPSLHSVESPHLQQTSYIRVSETLASASANSFTDPKLPMFQDRYLRVRRPSLTLDRCRTIAIYPRD